MDLPALSYIRRHCRKRRRKRRRKTEREEWREERERQEKRKEKKPTTTFLAINTCPQRRDLNFRTRQVSFGHKFC